LSWTRVIYMTIIKDKDYKCDRHFPIEILKKQYKIVAAKETDDLYFVTYNRR